MKTTTSASDQMKALLLGADDDLRDQVRTPRLLRLAQRCAALAPTTALASLGRRWPALHQEILQPAAPILTSSLPPHPP